MNPYAKLEDVPQNFWKNQIGYLAANERAQNVTFEIIKINYWFCDLIREKKLTKKNINLILLELRKLQKNNITITTNLATTLSFQINMLEDIATNYDNYILKQDFYLYLSKPCAFWLCYPEYKKLKLTSNLTVLQTEIENHFEHCWLIRLILEIFTNIGQRISWYIYLKLETLNNAITHSIEFPENNGLTLYDNQIRKLATECTNLVDYLPALQQQFASQVQNCFYLSIAELDVLMQNNVQTKSVFSQTEFAMAQTLHRDTELVSVISYCAGLLGINFTTSNIKNLLREILNKWRTIMQQLPTNTEFYWPNITGGFLIIQNINYLIEYIWRKKILNNNYLKLLINYASINQNLDLLNQEKVISTANYQAGVLVREQALSNSTAQFEYALQSYKADIPIVSESMQVIIFKNNAQKTNFLIHLNNYIQTCEIETSNSCKKTEFKNATENQIISRAQDNLSKDIEAVEIQQKRLDVIEEKQNEQQSQLLELDTKINQSSETLAENLTKEIQRLLSELQKSSNSPASSRPLTTLKETVASRFFSA